MQIRHVLLTAISEEVGSGQVTGGSVLIFLTQAVHRFFCSPGSPWTFDPYGSASTSAFLPFFLSLFNV